MANENQCFTCKHAYQKQAGKSNCKGCVFVNGKKTKYEAK